jgi:hypothetical protein
MANGQGTAILSFGSHPGLNEASVAVTGQATISATSNVEAYVMAEIYSTHTANDHAYFAMLAALTVGTPTAATGFTIYAKSPYKLTGDFKVHWVWAD